MRTLIIADNQDITKAGILYLSDRMPDLGLVTEAADKHELLQLLQQHPQAVVIPRLHAFRFDECRRTSDLAGAFQTGLLDTFQR